MPSTYAHYKFGKDVFIKLPKQLAKQITPYMPLYKIGLHGPDLLFYYKPLSANAVSSEGYQMHDRAGYVFFEKAKKLTRGSQIKEAKLAYLYGFICHFALDSKCHGYIDEKIIKSGVSHVEIEVEFDRFLLAKEGKNPLKQDLTRHIGVRDEYAKVIAPYFTGVTPKEVRRSLVAMKRYNSFLMASNQLKRLFIYGAMKASGQFNKLRPLVMNEMPNLKCIDSCEKLESLYNEAVEIAVQMIMEYYKNIDNDALLSQNYEITFGGQREKEASYAV